MEGAFRIINMVGTVTVHGWNKDTVLVRATLPQLDKLRMGGTFDFETHSGRIDIGVPDKVNADITVVTISGEIVNKLSRSRPVSGRFGRGTELNTEIGAGGAKVSVRTFKGPVTLRRPSQ